MRIVMAAFALLISASGAWANSASSSNQPGNDVGACRLQDPTGLGGCVDGVTQAQCDDQGGEFSVDQTCN